MERSIPTMTVEQAAKAIGKSPTFVRLGLQQKSLPFGSAVKTGERWSYVIPKNRFMKWFDGDDMSVDIALEEENQELKRELEYYMEKLRLIDPELL